jgi:hypothetical protein
LKAALYWFENVLDLRRCSKYQAFHFITNINEAKVIGTLWPTAAQTASE